MAKVLITGTAGFIGMHLALRLAEKGLTIVGIDSLNDYYDVQLKKARLQQQGIQGPFEYAKIVVGAKGISFVQLKMEDAPAMMDLFAQEKPDYVVSLAAQAGVRYSLENPQAYIDANITGFLSVLEGCRHYPVQHLLFASSSSVYGLNTNNPFQESIPAEHPISLYAASKKANEMMAHSYAHLYQIPCSGLRFFTVYGPWGRPDMALFIFTRKILAGEPIDLYNEGNMMRDFTYVGDIVKGIESLLELPPAKTEMVDIPSDSSSAPYDIYNIGNNAPVKLMDFVRAIEGALGKKAAINLMPLQKGDVPATYASVEKLMNKTGYKPNTPLEVGTRNFVEWYLDYYQPTT